MRNTIGNIIARMTIEAPSTLDTGCWRYAGKAHRNGYKLACLNGKQWRLHQLMWTVFYGPIPSGMEHHHRCEHKWCCNPHHLDLIQHNAHTSLHSGEVKARGARASNAVRRARPTCKHGHALTGANLGWRIAKGVKTRECLACKAIRARNRYR